MSFLICLNWKTELDLFSYKNEQNEQNKTLNVSLA